MKILLLGEFSALHKNLKEGLVELGHDVTIASSGDGWKNISGDINFSSHKKGLLGKVEKILKLIQVVPRLKNYDVVQFIAPVLFPRVLGLNWIITRFIIKYNRRIYLVGAGATDQITGIADFCEKHYKYPQLYKEIKKSNPIMWSQTTAGRKYNAWFFSQINGYIPIMYEYAQGYRMFNNTKLCRTVPIPMNIDKIKYKENIVGDKVVIFHGLNREGVKGTHIIREAMNKIQHDYPNDVECIIDGNMPLDEYLRFLERVNIVIDQAFSVSSGVNGVYNLAMGKVVLGGGEPEFLKEFKLENSPIIPIKPTCDSIYNQLKFLIENKSKITNIGKISREFTEKHHCYKFVAQQYIDIWKSKSLVCK
ncbi:TPA: glycosyltransferase [Vibrio vulnificus]|uniref:glycosyltransferase n=1 Tax=Vibrio vulnificus TaxID=672 RepID=UPI000D3E487A|nr:glycosyltransferase [Vibrio vulnificus]PUZ81416.1 glycosyltransferase [Vibrio vulnificus]HAS6416308.1 glycosyltransferase [Vibrio vulnificus]HAS8537746.1 glycosyltransferase [Vibrio vulnificus]HDY7491599.1 glycosyltransferase [Vibrio vulnificus]HDY8002271.1 glycosyltransferase [Vibrio vulnificus]